MDTLSTLLVHRKTAAMRDPGAAEARGGRSGPPRARTLRRGDPRRSGAAPRAGGPGAPPPRNRRSPPAEAAGFPTLYQVGLPALRRGRHRRPDDPRAARVEACLALIAHLEDTCLLHRGGPEGYAFARVQAARSIAEGGVARPDWAARAEDLHRAFVARNLSPGGAAELLAMTLFVDRVEAP